MKKSGQLLFILAVVLVLADRMTKLFFSCSSIKNTGTLFGILQGNNFLFILLSIGILLLIINYFTSSTLKQQIALIFVGSGIFSNLLDRIIHRAVLDFIDLGFWPAFNLADVFIVTGVIIFTITLFTGKK